MDSQNLFITEKELASLSGLSDSQYSTNYSTKQTILSQPFSQYVSLQGDALNYKDTQFVEVKNVIKKQIQSNVYIQIKTMYSSTDNYLGMSDSELYTKLYVQSKVDDDLNYPGSTFVNSTDIISWYNGSPSYLYAPDGSTHAYAYDSSSNNNKLYINGQNINLTTLNLETPIFVLVVFFDSNNTSANVVGYCVCQCIFQNSIISNQDSKVISKLIKVSDSSQVPYRMEYGSDSIWRCKLSNGSTGQPISYFYS